MSQDNFISFHDSLVKLAAHRDNLGESLSFGVPYLDDSLDGLPPSSVVLIGARTGVGKTQLVTQIACANAAAGKRVHFFALEAEPQEIQARLKYQLLAAYWQSRPDLRAEHKDITMNYMSWHSGRYGKKFEVIEKQIEEFLREGYKTLFTYYRDKSEFTVPWFKRQFESIREETDLVIVDHLHYFDFEDESENRALKGAMKAIRDCALISKKPVILVAHLRKRDRGGAALMPELDDFHGSSDLTKIATDVVLLAPAKGGKQGHWSTLMRVAKCRRDGSRTRYMGVATFNSNELKYDDKYLLSKYFEGQEETELIQYQSDFPYWAKNASRGSAVAMGSTRGRRDYQND